MKNEKLFLVITTEVIPKTMEVLDSTVTIRTVEEMGLFHSNANRIKKGKVHKSFSYSQDDGTYTCGIITRIR